MLLKRLENNFFSVSFQFLLEKIAQKTATLANNDIKTMPKITNKINWVGKYTSVMIARVIGKFEAGT
ncbi:Putative uncharacterized protein [Halomonas sp. R57-5]|nr:Putative uncharacterized protein [Halomonas sp. R57-5]